MKLQDVPLARLECWSLFRNHNSLITPFENRIQNQRWVQISVNYRRWFMLFMWKCVSPPRHINWFLPQTQQSMTLKRKIFIVKFSHRNKLFSSSDQKLSFPNFSSNSSDNKTFQHRNVSQSIIHPCHECRKEPPTLKIAGKGQSCGPRGKQKFALSQNVDGIGKRDRKEDSLQWEKA